MSDLTPFGRGRNDVFSFFDDMQKNFMKSWEEKFPAFQTDIVDKGDHYLLEADMPGFEKEDIQIHVDENLLTITAKQNVNKEENKEQYLRRERRYGSYTRSFDVSNVKTDEIHADYKNGVLKLILPKIKDENTARRIDID